MNDVDGAHSAHETSLHEVCAQKKETERKRPLWRPKRKWERTLGRYVTWQITSMCTQSTWSDGRQAAQR